LSYSDNISRLSRLTAILLALQTKPRVFVKELAEKFEVSTRTIYRDLESLEQSGVPIVSEEDKGYSLMNGYNIPPVMFTESEANALILAESIVARTKDESLIDELHSAIDKIKSVLRSSEKEKADFLSKRIIIGKNWSNDRTSSYLSQIKQSLTNFNVLQMGYRKESEEAPTKRKVEPFAIYHNTSEHWVMIAWCRLRNEFRSFRLDRIVELVTLDDKFSPHKMSLEEYVEIQRKKHQTL
jgi:predicted DNA-binding transcriptional regulator YafY